VSTYKNTSKEQGNSNKGTVAPENSSASSNGHETNVQVVKATEQTDAKSQSQNTGTAPRPQHESAAPVPPPQPHQQQQLAQRQPQPHAECQDINQFLTYASNSSKSSKSSASSSNSACSSMSDVEVGSYGGDAVYQRDDDRRRGVPRGKISGVKKRRAVSAMGALRG